MAYTNNALLVMFMVTQEHIELMLLLPLLPASSHELFITSHVMPATKLPIEACEQGAEETRDKNGNEQTVIVVFERDTMEEGVIEEMRMEALLLLLLLLLLLMMESPGEVRRLSCCSHRFCQRPSLPVFSSCSSALPLAPLADCTSCPLMHAEGLM